MIPKFKVRDKVRIVATADMLRGYGILRAEDLVGKKGVVRKEGRLVVFCGGYQFQYIVETGKVMWWYREAFLQPVDRQLSFVF